MQLDVTGFHIDFLEALRSLPKGEDACLANIRNRMENTLPLSETRVIRDKLIALEYITLFGPSSLWHRLTEAGTQMLETVAAVNQG